MRWDKLAAGVLLACSLGSVLAPIDPWARGSVAGATGVLGLVVLRRATRQPPRGRVLLAFTTGAFALLAAAIVWSFATTDEPGIGGGLSFVAAVLLTGVAVALVLANFAVSCLDVILGQPQKSRARGRAGGPPDAGGQAAWR